MPVLGALSVTLEVPDIMDGVGFYEAAGLEAVLDGNIARFRCQGQNGDVIVLLGGSTTKRLHHIALRADGLDAIATAVPDTGGGRSSPPRPASWQTAYGCATRTGC